MTPAESIAPSKASPLTTQRAQTLRKPIGRMKAKQEPVSEVKTPQQIIICANAIHAMAAEAPSSNNTESSTDPKSHRPHGSVLFDPVLSILAITLDDLEKARIAASNRYRILTTTEPDSDNTTRGFGLDPQSPAAQAVQVQVDGLANLEKQAISALEKQLKASPLYSHINSIPGLGLKTTARLLHAIRDPYWNDLHDRPRTVRELYAFCGLSVINPSTLPGAQSSSESYCRSSTGDQLSNPAQLKLASQNLPGGIAQFKQKGHKVNWSPEARMRIFLVSEATIKQNGVPDKNGKTRALSPYRKIYDDGRLYYANATHSQPCVRCGPAKSPAPANSPLSLAHQHARALRLVSKAILKDLWIESRRLSTEQ